MSQKTIFPESKFRLDTEEGEDGVATMPAAAKLPLPAALTAQHLPCPITIPHCQCPFHNLVGKGGNDLSCCFYQMGEMG